MHTRAPAGRSWGVSMEASRSLSGAEWPWRACVHHPRHTDSRLEYRVLDLANCRGLGAESLRGALVTPPGLPQLHSLTLDGLPELCDSLLSDIALALPLLTQLSLFRCGALTDVGLRAIAAACPRLLALRLGDVGRVTDHGLLALAQSCIGLEVGGVECTGRGCMGAWQAIGCMHAVYTLTGRRMLPPIGRIKLNR